MATTWTKFLKKNSGKGLSMTQLRMKYKKEVGCGSKKKSSTCKKSKSCTWTKRKGKKSSCGRKRKSTKRKSTKKKSTKRKSTKKKSTKRKRMTKKQ